MLNSRSASCRRNALEVPIRLKRTGAIVGRIADGNGEGVFGVEVQALRDLLVTFTTEQAEVEVTLTGLREPDDPENVLVMLFSEDPGRWHAGSVQYTAIQAL